MTMKHNEAVKILRMGVDAWNSWRLSKANHVISLRGADLRGTNLFGANLQLVELVECDLKDANLESANLGGASLRNANLQNARLLRAYAAEAIVTESDLRRANLQWAVLSGSNFSRANLADAELQDVIANGADFEAADLRGADMSRANLYGAKLREATVSHCVMHQTVLGNLDLSRVKGLETVKHFGPSSVGIETIYRSGGNVPEIFLRGAGVPEPFIVQMKSLVAAMSPIEFYSCFISYSHADKPFARRLHDVLLQRGVRCWLDEHQLLPGDDIYHEVDSSIRLWDKMLLCCSKHSLTSWWVDNEIGAAFQKENWLKKESGNRAQVLVPLNLDGYLFSDKWKSGYQAQIRRRLAADFTESGTDSAQFDAQVERLIRALRADVGAREKPPRAKL